MKLQGLFDAIIDDLTNSIIHVPTGISFDTLVLPLIKKDLPKISRKKGWKFDWKEELQNNDKKSVMKLVMLEEPDSVQGLISFKKEAGYYFMRLIEAAPFNVGNNKQFKGVAGNMIAYVCKESLEAGFEGVVSFRPKTALIEHYKSRFGARMISGIEMAIFEKEAKILVDLYYKSLR